MQEKETDKNMNKAFKSWENTHSHIAQKYSLKINLKTEMVQAREFLLPTKSPTRMLAIGYITFSPI